MLTRTSASLMDDAPEVSPYPSTCHGLHTRKDSLKIPEVAGRQKWSGQPAQQAAAAVERVGTQVVGGRELGGEAEILQVLDQQPQLVEGAALDPPRRQQLAPARRRGLRRDPPAPAEQPAPGLPHPQRELPRALLALGLAQRRLQLAGGAGLG